MRISIYIATSVDLPGLLVEADDSEEICDISRETAMQMIVSSNDNKYYHRLDDIYFDYSFEE